MSSQTQRYLTKLVRESDESLEFHFTQLEGKKDWGLLQTVFEEFIKHPILVSLERGRPLIKTSNTAILNNLVSIRVNELPDQNKIVFELSGIIFNNKIVDESKVGEEANCLQLNQDEYLVLSNISANQVGTVMALWYLVDWLNGMPIEVNYDDYVPTCANCVMNFENIEKYKHLFNVRVATYVEQFTECVMKQKEYKKGDGCDKFYIRNTYPDLGDVIGIIKDLL